MVKKLRTSHVLYFYVVVSVLHKPAAERFFFYEQLIKGDLKGIHEYISGCLWNERLKDKTDGSMSLTYTGRVYP